MYSAEEKAGKSCPEKFTLNTGHSCPKRWTKRKKRRKKTGERTKVSHYCELFFQRVLFDCSYLRHRTFFGRWNAVKEVQALAICYVVEF